LDEESIGSSISYIILSDSEAEHVTSPIVILDYALSSDTDTEPFKALPSPDDTPTSDVEIEPFEEDAQEAELDLEDSIKEDPSKEDPSEAYEPLPAQTRPFRTRMICRPRKTISPPYTLPPTIEATIIEEIAAPPRKRYKSPSPLPSSASPSPSPSPSRKRCRPPSLTPPPLLVPSSPLLPLSPLPSLISPYKRFSITSPQPETTDDTMTEAIIPTRLCKKSQACHLTFLIPRINIWKD
nr:hypothetical protein [Tanacetum cinerariifolium]